jgi:hypothetical protein
MRENGNSKGTISKITENDPKESVMRSQRVPRLQSSNASPPTMATNTKAKTEETNNTFFFVIKFITI